MELNNANEAITNYQELNDELCRKLETLEKDEASKATTHKNEQSDKLAESLLKISALQKRVIDMEQCDAEKKAEIARLTARNAEWEQKTTELFIEIEKNEIMQEKKDYERTVRMSEMAALLEEQRS